MAARAVGISEIEPGNVRAAASQCGGGSEDHTDLHARNIGE
jgi:hypothetical protein